MWVLYATTPRCTNPQEFSRCFLEVIDEIVRQGHGPNSAKFFAFFSFGLPTSLTRKIIHILVRCDMVGLQHVWKNASKIAGKLLVKIGWGLQFLLMCEWGPWARKTNAICWIELTKNKNKGRFLTNPLVLITLIIKTWRRQ